jgi:hypothetical protein
MSRRAAFTQEHKMKPIKVSDYTDDELVEVIRAHPKGAPISLETSWKPRIAGELHLCDLESLLYELNGPNLRCAVHFDEQGKIAGDPLKDDEGYAYFVGFNQYVKIGFTKDIISRIKGIQTSCPEKLIYYGSFVADSTTERNYHKKFDRYRLNGEWFHFGKEIRRHVGLPRESLYLV